MNLPEILQRHFNYPPLQKIDPNTQEVMDSPESVKHEFAQAAIPSILTGLYKLTRTDEGVAAVIRGELSTNWVKTIFGEKSQEIVERIADYSEEKDEEAERKLNIIAGKAAELIKENTAPDFETQKVKDLMADQRHHLFPYLPAVLQLGELLNDTTIDDKTNKMEGPVSSMIQAIGESFNKADDDNKISAN